MLTNPTSNEVVGTNALFLATIVGATLLLLGSIAAPANTAPAPAPQQHLANNIETVTVTASHLS